MDKSRAKEVLSVLAEGIDPYTGEVLPENHICNKGDVLRALQIAVDALSKQSKTKPLPENAGKPWTTEDEQALIYMFDKNMSAKEICAYFKRTKGSISARLVHIGKINSRDEFKLKY